MSSTGTESFTIGMHQVQPQKSPVQTQPSIPSMRLAYAPDGTAIYKPVTSSAPPVSPFHPPEVPEQSPAFNANTSESMKKKRGRPRKYGPDGTMSLALVPAGGGASAGGAVPPGFQTSPGGTAGSGDAVRKSKGGRPLGSLNKKKQMAALGSQGIGFTPHVITVKAGEDVSAKIMAFSQNGPRAICILSANGAISNVTLRQAATSGGTVTYEGRFEILSLSGSFLVSELSGGQRSRTGGLSVSLAGPDGRVLGGGVAGLLTAASPIQVVVGSFIAEGGKKEKKEKKEKKQVIYPDPLLAPRPVMAPTTGGSSSPSRGTMSESSGGPASPPNQSAGPFSSNNSNNNNPQSFANFPWK